MQLQLQIYIMSHFHKPKMLNVTSSIFVPSFIDTFYMKTYRKLKNLTL